MRVFIDTNILISAALFPNGVAAAAYEKAVSDPYDPVVSDYVVDELRRVWARKFPRKMASLDAFLAALSSCALIVATPEAELDDEGGDPRPEGPARPARCPCLRRRRPAHRRQGLPGVRHRQAEGDLGRRVRGPARLRHRLGAPRSIPLAASPKFPERLESHRESGGSPASAVQNQGRRVSEPWAFVRTHQS